MYHTRGYGKGGEINIRITVPAPFQLLLPSVICSKTFQCIRFVAIPMLPDVVFIAWVLSTCVSWNIMLTAIFEVSSIRETNVLLPFPLP